jgi:hypothetical protein
MSIAALARCISLRHASGFKTRGHKACHIALEGGKDAVLSEYSANLARKNEMGLNENYLGGKFIGKNE